MSIGASSTPAWLHAARRLRLWVAALAAVIGAEPVARPEAVKKMWEYIKAHNLQDPKDKRTIVADAKLRAVFGKDSAGMFELAGILGNHLGGEG
jgi:DNA topoisomerase-3